MEGLAQQMAGQSGPMTQMPTVEEVIQLLLQGIDPQQLLESGIPEELLLQALQVIEQQMQQSQPTENGLAQTMVA